MGITVAIGDHAASLCSMINGPFTTTISYLNSISFSVIFTFTSITRAQAPAYTSSTDLELIQA